MYAFARGSVVADKNLIKGQVISEDDIWTRRPGTGEIPANEFYSIIGKTLKNDVLKNTQLKRSDLAGMIDES